MTPARLLGNIESGSRYAGIYKLRYTNLLVEHVRLPHRLRHDRQGRALAHAREAVRDVDLQRLRLAAVLVGAQIRALIR
jgi:hypothetical protein